MTKRPTTTAGSPHAAIELTQNERQFIKGLLSNSKLEEIAAQTGKSIGSINHTRESLLAKMKVRSSLGIILWSLKYRVVTVKDISLAPVKKKRRT